MKINYPLTQLIDANGYLWMSAELSPAKLKKIIRAYELAGVELFQLAGKVAA